MPQNHYIPRISRSLIGAQFTSRGDIARSGIESNDHPPTISPFDD
jgi:hypothetical protein